MAFAAALVALLLRAPERRTVLPDRGIESSVMRRRVAIAFVLTAAGCALAAERRLGREPVQACAPGSPLLCARITVPLDRSGAVPGTVKLHVERLRSRGAARAR